MNRRTILAGAAGAAAATVFPQDWVSAADGKPRRILFFTRSAGFEHSVIKVPADGGKGHAHQVLDELGAKHGFSITHTKDGSQITAERLAEFDAIFFYTTGTLTGPAKDGSNPISEAGKAALLEAIQNGKGFLGSHSATDTFHTQPDPADRSNRYLNHGDAVDPYIAMIGAEFIKHGPQQVARMRCVDNKFPGFQEAGAGFELMDEWYSMKDFRKDLHVILVQETQGMKGPEYRRAPYPATWARRHGKGRVFYTSMGHREDVWTNPSFQKMLLGGIAWAVGNTRADVTPNIQTVTPNHTEIPPKSA